MDMRINSQLIISERDKRAWSQQHLATVTGLALRTIQRIETNGSGSYESVTAIASCLGVPISELRASSDREQSLRSRPGIAKATGSVVAASLLGGLAIFAIQGVFAEQILLDVGITISDQDDLNEYKTQLLLDEGEELDLPMEGVFNLVVVPTILEDGKVIMAVKLYEYHKDRGYELTGEPKVITPGGQEAEVVISSASGEERSYRISITPQIQ